MAPDSTTRTRRSGVAHASSWAYSPPIGHAQARAAALALAGEGIEVILSSPYLRTLQTAQPLAHASGLSIKLEDGLSELGHAPDIIEAAASRFGYFPEIDLSYTSLHSVEVSERDEQYPLLYLRKILRLAQQLPQKCAGQTVACFSHAASVAMVAALTDVTLLEAGKFAPCGIFKLVCEEGATVWTIVQHGSDNSAHCKDDASTTYPWGFSDSFQDSDQIEQLWLEAKRLETIGD
ncbi:unnamed protein product [Polarella glacialis]|uniref:Phosphoglycerate mutase n=1 Tax=Polarella glacialis TaxID=89957 RepID=A0A813GIA9_POLGL|nr:unnamed protein product [Polarella glacialis]